MLNTKNFSKVYIYDGSIYTDISSYALDYGRDYFEFGLETNNYLYFGRVKPFTATYVEMTAQTNFISSTAVVEYYNGSTWSAVPNLNDDSRMLSRSGFIQFDLPSDWAETTVGFHSRYFIRISPTVSTSSDMQLQGINILFSDDQDLNGVYPGVTNYRDSSELSFVLRHENSRNLIIQEIRNRGLRKEPMGSFGYDNYDAWDFLAIEEVRQWSIYLTLANIFSSLQSKEDGLYRQKFEEYTELASIYKAAFYLSLDKDNNGKPGITETAQDISTRRLVRR
jgi:hypothetical protein